MKDSTYQVRTHLKSQRGHLHILGLLVFFGIVVLVFAFIDHWQRVSTLEKKVSHLERKVELLDSQIKVFGPAM